MAHQMLATYRLLLNSARSVMDKRLPLHVQKARLTNSHDKAAITFMVAKLDQLEETYSPHKAYADGEKPVRWTYLDLGRSARSRKGAVHPHTQQ